MPNTFRRTLARHESHQNPQTAETADVGLAQVPLGSAKELLMVGRGEDGAGDADALERHARGQVLDNIAIRLVACHSYFTFE